MYLKFLVGGDWSIPNTSYANTAYWVFLGGNRVTLGDYSFSEAELIAMHSRKMVPDESMVIIDGQGFTQGDLCCFADWLKQKHGENILKDAIFVFAASPGFCDRISITIEKLGFENVVFFDALEDSHVSEGETLSAGELLPDPEKIVYRPLSFKKMIMNFVSESLALLYTKLSKPKISPDGVTVGGDGWLLDAFNRYALNKVAARKVAMQRPYTAMEKEVDLSIVSRHFRQIEDMMRKSAT